MITLIRKATDPLPMKKRLDLWVSRHDALKKGAIYRLRKSPAAQVGSTVFLDDLISGAAETSDLIDDLKKIAKALGLKEDGRVYKQVLHAEEKLDETFRLINSVQSGERPLGDIDRQAGINLDSALSQAHFSWGLMKGAAMAKGEMLPDVRKIRGPDDPVPAPPYILVLTASPNVDFGAETHEGSVELHEEREVESLEEASREAQSWIRGNSLGAGNFHSWLLDATGRRFAHVSYNGRVWLGRGDDWREALNAKPIYDPRAR